MNYPPVEYPPTVAQCLSCQEDFLYHTAALFEKLEFVSSSHLSHSNLFQYSFLVDSSSFAFGTIEPAKATVSS